MRKTSVVLLAVVVSLLWGIGTSFGRVVCRHIQDPYGGVINFFVHDEASAKANIVKATAEAKGPNQFSLVVYAVSRTANDAELTFKFYENVSTNDHNYDTALVLEEKRTVGGELQKVTIPVGSAFSKVYVK